MLNACECLCVFTAQTKSPRTPGRVQEARGYERGSGVEGGLQGDQLGSST